MERTTLEKPTLKRRLWLRVLAVVLAVGLLAGAGLVEASRVIFDATSGANAAERDAGAYLAETTDFLNEPLSARMADVLLSYIRKPVSYADHALRMSLLISKGDYAAAAQACAKCIELWQDEAQPLSELWTKLACLHALLGEYAAARAELDTAVSLGAAGEDPSVYLLRAQMSAQLGEVQSALDDMAAYETQTGDAAALLSIKAPLLEAAGDYAAAQAAYTAQLEAKEGEGFDPAAYGGRARVRMLLSDYAGAMADAQAFFAAGQEDADGSTRYILAACAMQFGDYARAQENLLLALEAGYSQSADVYSLLLYVQYMQGDLAGAKQTGETALGLEGGESAELLRWLGIIEMAQGGYGAAVDYFSRSIALEDTQQDLHYYLGVCLVAQNQYAEAAEEFTISIERGESLANSHYNRGVCYAALGDNQSAYEDMVRAIALSDEAELTASATQLMQTLAKALGES